jgi:hypothetical protein
MNEDAKKWISRSASDEIGEDIAQIIEDRAK